MIGREDLPDPVEQRRRSAGGLVRGLYGALILGLGLVLGWLVVKPVIYTQTPGQVLAPTYVVSMPFEARVHEMRVRPGDTVRRGDLLAVLNAPSVNAMIIDLTMALADEVARAAELNIRLKVARAAIPSAELRISSAAKNLARMEGSCVASAAFCAEIYREYSEATSAFSRAQTEALEIETQLIALGRSRAEIEALRADLIASFKGGEQRSPVDGVVSPRIAQQGQSVGPGDVVAEVLEAGQAHIDWVLDAGRVRQPRVGDVVYVLDGNRVMRGRISALLAISDSAASGSSLFRPAASGQVVRLHLDAGETYPPLLTNVEVRYNYWRVMDQAVEVYVRAMEWIGLWRRS